MPPLCGADINELRGKCLLYAELKGNTLMVESKSNFGFHFYAAFVLLFLRFQLIYVTFFPFI